MPDEPEVIRQQMHETRSALTEKLETLEQTVVGTVADAQNAVQETVENVKDAVQETVAVVKDSVQEGVQSVRRAFDLQHQMNEYPWLFVGGSVALGYLCGRAIQPALHGRQHWDDRPRQNFGSPHGWQPALETNGHAEPSSLRREETASAPREESWLTSLQKSFASEIDKVKALAIGVGVGMVRDMLSQAAPENLRPQVGEIMNNLTTKLGGETIREPILEHLTGTPSTQERYVHDSWSNECSRGSRDEVKSSQFS